MGYITIEELKYRMSYGTMARLSNDEDPSRVNTTVVQAHIDDASNFIDNVIRQAYDDAVLPFTTPDDHIKAMVASVAKYTLYERRGEVPTAIQRAYDIALEQAEKYGLRRKYETSQGMENQDMVIVDSDETDSTYGATETFTVEKMFEDM